MFSILSAPTDPTASVDLKTFSTVTLAKTHLLVLYWSVWLLLYFGLGVVCDKVLPLGFNVYGVRQNVLKHCLIFFEPEAGWFGSNIAILPTRIALYIFNDASSSPKEERLLKNILGMARGNMIFSFLRSM